METITQFIKFAKVDLISHLYVVVLNADILLECSLQLEELLFILEVLLLLGPVTKEFLLKVCKYCLIKLPCQGLVELTLRNDVIHSVCQFLVKIELQYLLNHHWQMLLNRQQLRLQEVHLVGGFIQSESLFLNLKKHLVVHKAFQIFHLNKHQTDSR